MITAARGDNTAGTGGAGGRIRAAGQGIVAVAIMALLPLSAPTPASASPGDNELISFAPAGEEFTGNGFAFDTSADGQRTVMWGQSSSLPSPSFGHFLLRDGSTTVQLDPNYADTHQIGISDNGRWVAYINHNELVLTDLDTNQVRNLAAVEMSSSGRVDVSDDGQTVAFDTTSALDPILDTDDARDVYVWHGGSTPTLELVGRGTSGPGEQDQFNALTPDGQHLLYTSTDHWLAGDTTTAGYTGLYLRDLVGQETTIESRYDTAAGGGVLPTGVWTRGDLTDDGQTIVFSSQDDVTGNYAWYRSTIYVRDHSTGNAHILATSGNGAPVFMYWPSIDGAGKFVVAQTDWGLVLDGPQSNWPQQAAVEVATGTWQLVSHAYGNPNVEADTQSLPAYMSGDGRSIIYNSSSNNLLATPFTDYDNRVYRYEVQGNTPPDADTDGIDDNVDVDSGDGSLPGAFADDVVNGTITFVPAGFTVTVTDAADPLEGVRVQVVGTGTARVRLLVCGVPLTLRGGSDVTFTCGSVIAAVDAGDVVVELADGLGSVTIPAGTAAEVGTGTGGSFFVNVIDATGDGGTQVTLTVDGVTSTLESGSTSFQAWDFVGFAAPIDNAPTINKIKGGRGVAVKWRLLTASGSPVTNLATATLRFAAGVCTGSGAATDDIEQTVTGSSGLLNLGNGNYQMNWKTPLTPTSCGQLHLTVGDGVVHTALFRIT